MNEAVYCTKCKKTYYNHDVRSCSNPDWEDIKGETVNFQFNSEPNIGIVMGKIVPGHPHRLTFYKDNQEVGYLDLDRGADFHGDATESAKVFFKIVTQLWENQLSQTK